MADPWAEFETVSAHDFSRPMVAHAQKGSDPWAGFEDVRPESTMTDEPRIPIGIDPRLEPETAFTEEEYAGVPGQIASGLIGMGAGAAIGPAGRVLASPLGLGAVEAARAKIEGSSNRGAIARGAVAATGGSLLQRLAGRLLAGKAAEAAAPVVEEAAPAVGRAYQGIPSMMKITAPEAAPVATESVEGAKSILKALAPKAAAEAAPVAKAAESVVRPGAEAGDYLSKAERAAFEADRVRRLDAALAERMGTPETAVPAKGQSRMATVYTKPSSGPKPITPAQEALRAKQAQAAEAAGVDIGEAFGRPPVRGATPKHEAVTFHSDPSVDAQIKESLPGVADALEKGKGTARGYIETGNHSGDLKPYGATDTGVKAALGLDDMPQSRKVIAAAIRRDKGNDIERAVAQRIGVQIEEQVDRGAARAVEAVAPEDAGLLTRLRASVMMKNNPMALAQEVEGKVRSMRGARPSEIRDAIEAAYGFPRPVANEMVERILGSGR